MISEISPKIAENIIKTLEAGIVPKKGIQYLLVGRNDEVHEIISILDRVSEGESDIRFWVGDFGSGKSFIGTLKSLMRIIDFKIPKTAYYLPTYGDIKDIAFDGFPLVADTLGYKYRLNKYSVTFSRIMKGW